MGTKLAESIYIYIYIYISPYTGYIPFSRFDPCVKFDCYDKDNPTMSLAEDSILAQLIEQDRVPWYNKPNLRALYALMIPVCMGVEWAIGFDSAMMASFQTIDNWAAFFDYPSSGRLGFIIASYALGGTITIPLGTFVGDRFGRKVSVIVGSSITGLGALIQAGAQNCECFYSCFFS